MTRLLFALALALPLAAQRPVETIASKAGDIRITPVRHASLMIEAGGKVIHVDPWKEGSYDGLPAADLVLITDIHGDHMDPVALPKVRKEGTVIVAPAAVAKTVTDATVLANGESKSFGPVTVEAVPMYNLKRGPAEGKLFHDKGRGNGYVISYGGTRIYIAGDTEGTPEMRALRNITVAFIPMNLPYTMPPEEAADAVRAFQPKIVYPYHYRQSDTKIFAEALKDSGIEVRLRDWYY